MDGCLFISYLESVVGVLFGENCTQTGLGFVVVGGIAEGFEAVEVV